MHTDSFAQNTISSSGAQNAMSSAARGAPQSLGEAISRGVRMNTDSFTMGVYKSSSDVTMANSFDALLPLSLPRGNTVDSGGSGHQDTENGDDVQNQNSSRKQDARLSSARSSTDNA